MATATKSFFKVSASTSNTALYPVPSVTTVNFYIPRVEKA